MKLSKKLSNNLDFIRRIELCPSFLNVFSEKYSFGFLINDLLSGIKIFLFMLPIVLSLSFFCGSVIQGIISCMIAAIISCIFGGSKYQISSISLPLCVVIFEITSKYQYKGLLYTAIFVSAILIIFGLLRLSSVLKHVSYVFISALSVYVIFSVIINQIQYILNINTVQSSQNLIENFALLKENLNKVNSNAIITALCFISPLAILRIFSNKMISFTIYLALGAALVFVANSGYLPYTLDIKTLGSDLVSTQAVDNIFNIARTTPPQTFLMNCLNYAFAIAIVIASETCFCTNISTAITGNRFLQNNIELISTGLTNLISVALGGLFISPNLTFTMKNISQKSKTIISLIILGLLFYVFMHFDSTILTFIPTYCISSILICYLFSEFTNKKIFRYFNLKSNDSYVFLLTLFTAMYFGFVTAVTVGFMATLIFFSKRMVKIKDASVHTTRNHDTGAIEFMRNKNGISKSQNIPNYILEKIEVIQIDNILILNIAKTIEETLISRGNFPSVLIIYFKNIPFLDTEALRYLKDFVKMAREKNCLVMVSGTNGMLLDILQQKANDEKNGNTFGYIIPNFSEAIEKTVKRLKAS